MIYGFCEQRTPLHSFFCITVHIPSGVINDHGPLQSLRIPRGGATNDPPCKGRGRRKRLAVSQRRPPHPCTSRYCSLSQRAVSLEWNSLKTENVLCWQMVRCWKLLRRSANFVTRSPAMRSRTCGQNAGQSTFLQVGGMFPAGVVLNLDLALLQWHLVKGVHECLHKVS